MDLVSQEEKFWSKVDKSGGPDACWPWMGGRDKLGYGRMARKLTHRRAWEYATGSIDPALDICHRCDFPPCCNVRHLFAGTAKDNMADRDAKGRGWVPHGSKHHKAVLTEADIPEIRALHAAGIRAAEIGRRYNVTRITASRVTRGKTWKHVA